MIEVRSDRAMPPAPKLACRTRPEGGVAANKRGVKKGRASELAAVARRKARRLKGREEFMGSFLAQMKASRQR